MAKVNVLPPHGGMGLINRMIPEIEREHFVEKVLKHKVYTISDADLATFYRIADGTLSPLEGPMNSAEFNQVLDTETIERDGKAYSWTIPMAFPISKQDSEAFEVGEEVAVKNQHGVIIGGLEISDIYPFDKAKYNKVVYGTERTDHPGPRIMNDDPRDYLIGGKIWAIPKHRHNMYGKYMLTPKETRTLFQERKWERIVAFQTRNALHRAHEYTMVHAMETLTKEGIFAGVVLNPLVGAIKKDDVPAEVRMKTYEALLQNNLLGYGDTDEEFWNTQKYQLRDNVILVGLDIKMFYAGPKEAVMHAIYRQNHGFTDIIIGRKHADAPFDDGEAVWGDFDAQEIFEKLSGELQIKPFKVGFAAYMEELGRVGLLEKYESKGYKTVRISGKDLRKKLEESEDVDERIMRAPIASILSSYYKTQQARKKEEEEIKGKNLTWHDTKIDKKQREIANNHRAAVLWFTGLSGSGKSTIAVELQKQLFARGHNVYVLDGDNVRQGLNKNLGFSPEDRTENIRRIGEVAKLFADAGFLAITSFISPYRKDRDNVRNSLPQGDFVEIFVKTSVEECEKRDPKGLYKKARAGEIPEFTGISAPYEEPENPELIVDTVNESKEESAGFVVQWLEERRYIPYKVV